MHFFCFSSISQEWYCSPEQVKQWVNVSSVTFLLVSRLWHKPTVKWMSTPREQHLCQFSYHVFLPWWLVVFTDLTSVLRAMKRYQRQLTVSSFMLLAGANWPCSGGQQCLQCTWRSIVLASIPYFALSCKQNCTSPRHLIDYKSTGVLRC